ncbi:MAG: flagellar basal body rod C-terminal domain-containing protein [Caulobacteraceae bacterium]
MNVLSTALAGMTAATNRFEAGANMTLRSFTPEGSDADMAEGVVAQVSAKHEFEANVRVAKIADEMMGVLLDMKV